MSDVIELRLGNTAPIETVLREVTKAQAEASNGDALNPQARKEVRVDNDGRKHEVYLAPEKVSIVKRLGITEVGKAGPDGTTTVIHVPEGTRPLEALVSVARLWRDHHSDAPPAWIECDEQPFMAELLADEWSTDETRLQRLMAIGAVTDPKTAPDTHQVKVGRPKGWKSYSEPVSISGGSQDMDRFIDDLFFQPLEPWDLLRIANLRTSAGRDFQSRVMGDTASNGTGSYAAANYIGLSTNATAPADGDTTLTGELTTNGLQRAQAAYAHTGGANTYTLTKTYTSTDGTPRTIEKIGVFNASAAGTMVFETALSSPPTLTNGDSLTVTETVSLV